MKPMRPVVALLLEPGQALLPGDEVVDLLEVDVPAVEAELVGELAAALRLGRRPDLRRDDAPRRGDAERPAEHALGPTVHWRRVDEPRARAARPPPTTSPREPLLGSGNVEHLPGPEPDHGQLEAGAPEASPLHTVCDMPAGEPTRRSRAPPRPASTRGPAARTSRSSRSSRRGRRARTCARSTASPGSSTTSATRPPATVSALLDELERELEGVLRGSPRRIMRRLHATIAGARAAARAVRAPDRGEPDRPAARAATRPGRTSAGTAPTRPSRSGDSCSGSTGRAGEPGLVAMTDDVCTGLQLVNFLQDPPRDLALGRVYLPQEDLRRFGVADDELAGPALRAGRGAVPVRGRSGPGAPGAGLAASPGARRTRRAVGRALRPRWTRGARGSRARRLGRLHAAARADAPCVRRPDRAGAGSAVRIGRRVRRGRASRAARPATSPGASCCCRGRSASPWRRSTRSPGGSTTSPTIPRSRSRSGGAAWPPAAPRSKRFRARRDDAVLVALADTLERYAVPAERAARPGGRRSDGRREEPLRDLGRASRVLPLRRGRRRARLHSPSTSPTDPDRGRPARRDLGLALQQINIMRDVAEDWRLGRVYLPQDELAAFRRRRGRHRGRPRRPGVARAHGSPGLAGGERSCATASVSCRSSTAAARSASAPSPGSTAVSSTRCAVVATTSSRAAHGSRRSARHGRSSPVSTRFEMTPRRRGALGECEARTQGAFVAGGYGRNRGRRIVPASAARRLRASS